MPWLVVSGLLVAAVLYVGVRSRAEPSSVSTAPAKEEQRFVTLSVAATPLDAEVLLDGKPVGSNRWTTGLPASDQSARIEVTSFWHRPFTQQVTLNADVSLSVQLEPVAAASDPVASASKRTSNGVGRHHVDAPSVTARSATIASKANCNPPHVFDSEGVKIFKPECS